MKRVQKSKDTKKKEHGVKKDKEKQLYYEGGMPKNWRKLKKDSKYKKHYIEVIEDEETQDQYS